MFLPWRSSKLGLHQPSLSQLQGSLSTARQWEAGSLGFQVEIAELLQQSAALQIKKNCDRRPCVISCGFVQLLYMILYNICIKIINTYIYIIYIVQDSHRCENAYLIMCVHVMSGIVVLCDAALCFAMLGYALPCFAMLRYVCMVFACVIVWVGLSCLLIGWFVGLFWYSVMPEMQCYMMVRPRIQLRPIWCNAIQCNAVFCHLVVCKHIDMWSYVWGSKLLQEGSWMSKYSNLISLQAIFLGGKSRNVHCQDPPQVGLAGEKELGTSWQCLNQVLHRVLIDYGHGHFPWRALGEPLESLSSSFFFDLNCLNVVFACLCWEHASAYTHNFWSFACVVSRDLEGKGSLQSKARGKMETYCNIL